MSRKITPNQFYVVGETAHIILTNAAGDSVAEAIVDVEDLGRVLALGRWFANGPDDMRLYAKAKKGRVLLHRFVMDAGPDVEVDHRRHNTLDCRKQNLRACSHTGNMQNRDGAHKNSKSGIRGVWWEERRGKWRVEVRANRKRHMVGQFDSIQDAEQAAIEARQRLHGEFAA